MRCSPRMYSGVGETHLAAIRALTALLILLSCRSFASEITDGTVGFNKFDLVQQYLAGSGAVEKNALVSREGPQKAKKAIDDAHRLGIRYLRVPIAGYAPSVPGAPGDLDLWVSSPEKYWAVMDEMMGDLKRADIRIVPTFVWNVSQFPAMENETVADLLNNPRSRSYSALSRYVSEFVARYKDTGTILFYELANELNLGADIDTVDMCTKGPYRKQCEVKANYTTADMIAFTGRLSRIIRSLDPHARISSGYSVPRPAAQHLRWRNGIPPNKPDWTKDSPKDLEAYLKSVNQYVDIISVHLYPLKENSRFGSNDPVELLVELKKAADNVGKPLFVGEFGDSAIRTAGAHSYVVRMLEEISAIKVPYSAVWVWEFHQRPSNDHGTGVRPDDFNLEPGVNDRVIDHLVQVNRKMEGDRAH